MSPEEKRMQLSSIITVNNVVILKELLMSLMLETRTRVLEDGHSTVVYNAKVDGQLELLDKFITFSENFINPMN